MFPLRKFNFQSIDVCFINVLPISTYINTKMCVCVCVSVCLFAFFSAIWNPIGIPFGTNVLFDLEMVLTQKYI